MSVIVRLQNLPWAANAVDIRQYFHGLSIPEGGVHIVGGELGDAFIAFSTDEDARQAMLRDGGKVKEIKIRLFLSSRAEMQKIIEQARQQSLGMQQFMTMPAMPQMSVPVQNMSVPNMSVQNVAMPSNVHNVNVPGMQVSMQNVPNVGTMVGHHMVPKQNENNITAPSASAVGMIPIQPDPPQITPTGSGTPPVPSGTTMATTTATPTISASTKGGDSEKDKKDKRRRRTRSHSRDRSDSRSRSRSPSRSRSRSKDRKGRDRDRYYDRRRRRSRSRDRRRRRDRSRSRDRSSRDKRRDRHGSKEDADDSSQQSSSSSRWGNPLAKNQPAKPRADLLNRQQPNRDAPFVPRGAPNTNNIRPPFPKPNAADQNTLQPSDTNVNSATMPPLPPNKDTNSSNFQPQNVQPPATKPMIISAPVPPSSVSSSATSANNNAVNTMAPSANFFGTFQQHPPAFNPQQIVSYPTFSPSGPGMISHNTGFNIPGSQMQRENMTQGTNNKQESFDNKKKSLISDTKPNLSPTMLQQTNMNQMKFNNPETKSEPSKPAIPSGMMANEIPLPDNSLATNNSGFGWGYGGTNYEYNRKSRFSDYQKEDDNSSSIYQEQFQQTHWENTKKSSDNSAKIPNTCVQIKNVPYGITAEDVRAFFRHSAIPNGWLKILNASNVDGKDGVVYVRFTSLHDKKQAILRSGCLLNNSIVTILHVDDGMYEKAVDTKSSYTAPPGFWNVNSREDLLQKQQQKEISMNKPPAAPLENKQTQRNKEPEKGHNCVRIDGSMRYHPFFTHNHKMYPHIRMVCDRFKPVDVCVTRAGGQNLNGYMKFESSDVIDTVMRSLSNAKVEGRSISVSTCSQEEFDDGKNDCMPLDTQKFLKNAKLPHNKNFDSKQEVKSKPRNESGFTDPRMTNDMGTEDDYDDDVEMKIEDESVPEAPRNKVLLPTPPAQLVMQPQFDGHNTVPPTNCILLHNLPYQANDSDILDFFSDVGVIPNQIHIMLDENGKSSGDAFCEFDKSEEAITAAGKNNCPMGRNTVFVRLVSREEMSNALGIPMQNPVPNMLPEQCPPFFNERLPPGPPMFGGMPMDQSMNDFGPPFHPPGLMGPPGSPYHDSFNSHMPPGGRGRGRGIRGIRGSRGGRGGMDGSGRGGRGGMDSGGRGGRGPMNYSDRGGRGSRGPMESSERGIRGRERGRGSSRGGFGGSFRGNMEDDSGSNRRGSGLRERGSRGRGRGSSREMNERNQPPPLMSLSAVGRAPTQVQLEENKVREFGRPGCVVSVENVPYRATINDILEFFGDFNLAPECVIRRYDDEGKITGDARVSFDNASDARRAVRHLDGEYLMSREISLQLFK